MVLLSVVAEVVFEEQVNLTEPEALIDIDGEFTVLVVEDNHDMRDFVCRLLNICCTCF